MIAGILLVPLALWFVTHESSEHKIDREVEWKEVKPYYTTTHGVEVGQVTVPGHNQRVTFYMWEIPKEAYIDQNEKPKIIGEMNRDAEHVLDDLYQS